MEPFACALTWFSMTFEKEIVELNEASATVGTPGFEHHAAEITLAELHNRIFQITWAATGRSRQSNPPTTWWEHFQPSNELAVRYHPSLVKFFQRVYYHPAAPEFFYYLQNLNTPECLIDEDFNDIFDGRDCYVHLHRATNWNSANGDEWDIINESLTECIDSMITENKVEVQVNGQWPLGEIGTDKLAFQALLHEIEIRLPSTSSTSTSSDSAQSESSPSASLPWFGPAVLSEARLVPNSFINRFCTATSTATPRPVRFRYIAPGVRLPTEAEFRAQPFRDAEYKSALWRRLPVVRPIKPILLFLADAPPDAHSPGKTVMAVPKPDTWLNSLLSGFGDGNRQSPPPRPAGLYLTADNRDVKMTARAWATTPGWGGNPADANYDLYQCEFNGFIPWRDTPLHQVLESWAERVRAGDWTVGEDGVADGVERWREADTEAGWRKYWIPVRW
ncbi:hypothetical protein BO82DRAFT_434859 [Aspergillus uvarum CBS 121591]|uniref:Uncharacterized protein n=1 Tax=Aspergillus uvarum CBS 121591 TaxID=1448315 RepID=A0A319C0N6_9EURO|nr:hypothetical protein BO82DRAFT_434859 [Aspergillus uvarum CBS 121591]PYH78634.1 hypothetical protein BO82DRAFT_434859 [Aspergillus uvarum CBS 121591]